MDSLTAYLVQLKRELVIWYIENKKIFRQQHRNKRIENVEKEYEKYIGQNSKV